MDTYITGHKPKETYAQLVARINAGSTIGAVTVEKRKRRHRVLEAIDKLSEQERAMLLDILQNRCAVVYVNGASYTVRKEGEWWHVRCLADGPKEYVLGSEGCTCEDSRFRNRECKHQRAVQCVK